MPFSRRPAVLLCLLALWLQMLAPALALGMQRHAFDPLSTICHSQTVAGQAEHREKSPRTAACDHCLLCHATAGAVAPDGPFAVTAFDYPVTGLRHRVPRAAVRGVEDPLHRPRPRGPPSRV